VIDRLSVEAEHGERRIGFRHGLHHKFYVGCYVNISTGLEGFLENDTERCFSLVLNIFLLNVVRTSFLWVFLIRSELVRVAVRRGIRHGRYQKLVFLA